MFHYLHLRSRFLQTLILVLIGLTFYAYYRTTVYDVRQYSLPRNTSKYYYIYKIFTFIYKIWLCFYLDEIIKAAVSVLKK